MLFRLLLDTDVQERVSDSFIEEHPSSSSIGYKATEAVTDQIPELGRRGQSRLNTPVSRGVARRFMGGKHERRWIRQADLSLSRLGTRHGVWHTDFAQKRSPPDLTAGFQVEFTWF